MLWRIVLAFLIGEPTDVAALRDTAPVYLTTARAAEHLAAARTAGAVYNVDPDILLSIAWHESRYLETAVTEEAGGKVSCGTMTPEPTYDRTSCTIATSSVLAGYIAGARHLRTWIDVSNNNLHTALRGYAGGYALIAACQRDEGGKNCAIWDVFLHRAAQIRTLRAKRRQGVSW